MNSILQTTLFGDAFQSAKTNKRQFLEKMDSLIPWQDWVSIMEPIYYEGIMETNKFVWAETVFDRAYAENTYSSEFLRLCRYGCHV